MEKDRRTSDVIENVKIEEANEELKMDLAGYVGDFNRHRFDPSIKKRVGLTEEELVSIILEEDRLKEVTLAIRDIDPDRNGFVTQQELDDIFRENYREKMEGKHLFDLIKDFRSITNKILVDYGKFKKWLYSSLKKAKRQKKLDADPRRALIQSILSKTMSERDEAFDEV